MSTASAPMEIGRVRLITRDLTRMADFYAYALGLEKLSADASQVTLGAGDRALVELVADPAARVRTPREAGLFHTAFLLPKRSDLGAWVHFASNERLPVQGASDHLVSEAIYFADPEGNGIEIYTDRPRTAWYDAKGAIKMATDPLDVPDLAASARGPWKGAPVGTVVGHVHLQVGNVAEAEAFYSEKLGFPITAHYPGAAFYGSGGYHHHLATNIWNSRNAGPRQAGTGLASVEILADAAALAAVTDRIGGASVAADPWGTEILFTAKAA